MTAERIFGNSPWGRAGVRGLDSGVRASIAARIPDDHYITVGARRKPGDWSIRLMFGYRERYAVEVAKVIGALTIAGGCERLFAQLALNAPAEVWCSLCPGPSTTVVDGEAYCAAHVPKREEAAA